jgi:hypothetical protein
VIRVRKERSLPVLAGILGTLCGWSSPALAQVGPPASRLDVGIGVLWIGAEPLGTRPATETTGAGGAVALFNSSSELAGAVGIDGRVGVRLSRSLVAEAEASYLKPQLRISISGDTEGAAAVTATEAVQQFTLGGNVLWYLMGSRWSSRRFAPFAMAGAGYLRQLHDQGTLLATGHFYQVGGGVSGLLVSRRRFHTNGVGVRADVRALVRSKGVAFDGGSKVSPAAGAALFVRF